MGSINSMMAIFNVLIGVFCIYSAITGKGAAYKNDYPEEIKPMADKSMRILMFAVGPIALFLGAQEYFEWGGAAATTIIQYIGIGVELVLIIGYIVWFRVKFGKVLNNPKVKKIQ